MNPEEKKNSRGGARLAKEQKPPKAPKQKKTKAPAHAQGKDPAHLVYHLYSDRSPDRDPVCGL